MKKNKGFTFVELLVVITIIAVVFAAGVVSYTSISKNSRDARRKADMEAIRQAVEMCRSITGSYPSGIYIGPTNQDVACNSTNTTMYKTPKDPKDGSNYSYSTTGTGYSLTTSKMENIGNPYTVTNP